MFRYASKILAIAFVMIPALSRAQNAAPSTRPAPALHAEAPDVPVPKIGRGGAPDRGFMAAHQRYVDLAKKGGIDLYMEGDSITDFWQHMAQFTPNWNRNLGGWKVGDFGISGDRTEHVLWRIENGELDGVTPKVIVLLIGTNNLTANTTFTANSAEDTFNGVKAIVTKLQEKQPQAHILLLAVFPRADKPAEAEVLTGKINALNKLIATLDDGKQIKFMDINDKFADKDGTLISGMMRDKLHPSAAGYDAWAAAIRPTLVEWLGEPPATTQPAGN